MNELLIKIFGIDTYEMENERLNDEIGRLDKMLSQLNETNKVLASDIIKLEDEIELLQKDPDQYVEREVEKRMIAYEKAHECEMNHRWYGIGRQDAYREMGIKNIEAHRRGNVLVQDENGEIVELIQGLEDVDADIEIVKHMDMKVNPSDEIQINDLIG